VQLSRIYAISEQSVKRIEALHPLLKCCNMWQPKYAICSNQIWPKRLYLPAFDTHSETPIFAEQNQTKRWPLAGGVDAALAKNGCTFPVWRFVAWQTMPVRRLRIHAHRSDQASWKSKAIPKPDICMYVCIPILRLQLGTWPSATRATSAIDQKCNAWLNLPNRTAVYWATGREWSQWRNKLGSTARLPVTYINTSL